MSYGFRVIVEGDYACFTRPEMKVERVSYDVPTPGALEGLLKCVYWKPSIRYVIDRIIVFNPIKFINIRRNEAKEKVDYKKVKLAMNGKGGSPEIFISAADKTISQRAGMLLKDVRYGIEFHFEMTGIRSDHEDESEEKHYKILMRRLRKGQCFRQPVLGCREFSVTSLQLVDEFPMNEISEKLKGDTDLGFMLYRMNFKDGGIPLDEDWEKRVFSDSADPSFYRPHLVDGVIDVQKYRGDMRC